MSAAAKAMELISDDTWVKNLLREVHTIGQEEIVPRFKQIQPEGIMTKTAMDDFATEADRQSELRLAEIFREYFPGALIVGEEAAADDPTLRAKVGDTAVAVILDPLDGTWNFVNRMPLFGMIIAIVINNETVFGLIHYPMIDEYIVATKGGGAWLLHGGVETKLQVPTDTANLPIKKLYGLASIYSFPQREDMQEEDLKREDMRTKFALAATKFRRVGHIRVSCYEYQQVLLGKQHFVINKSLKVWDHAAGVLMVCEAGGYAAVVDGKQGVPYKPSMMDGMLLVAPDKGEWERIRAVFFD